MLRHLITYQVLLAMLFCLCRMTSLQAQSPDDGKDNEHPEKSVLSDPATYLWVGSYANNRISDKFFWHGELHYRRTQYDGTPFVGRMAQLYNRHGLKYVPTKNFSATAGGVLRLDFTPEPENNDLKDILLEPRIWHEYIFAMPFPRFRIYHRIRIEHRWSRRGFEKGPAPWDYRNRFRYKFLMKIPLNNKKLIPGTVYFSPDIELIMQSGEIISDNPFEDLRLYPSFAYIANPRMSYSIGAMWTTGQQSNGGYQYKNRWVLKLNAYLSFDFRKFQKKIPEVNIED